jgi:toxin CptA
MVIQRNHHSVLAHVWSPHVATTVIGITFLVALVTAGNWTYSEFLSDLAHGVTLSWISKSLLYFALLGGAIFGGWTAGRLKHSSPDARSLLHRLGGGIMMGAGGTLIPGGNTGLILVGMPLLLSYAWLAFVAICATIYLAIRLTGIRLDDSF